MSQNEIEWNWSNLFFNSTFFFFFFTSFIYDSYEFSVFFCFATIKWWYFRLRWDEMRWDSPQNIYECLISLDWILPCVGCLYQYLYCSLFCWWSSSKLCYCFPFSMMTYSISTIENVTCRQKFHSFEWNRTAFTPVYDFHFEFFMTFVISNTILELSLSDADNFIRITNKIGFRWNGFCEKRSKTFRHFQQIVNLIERTMGSILIISINDYNSMIQFRFYFKY